MKFGNTDFNRDACIQMGWENFQKAFSHLKLDLKEVYLQLGGKIEKPKANKKEED